MAVFRKNVVTIIVVLLAILLVLLVIRIYDKRIKQIESRSHTRVYSIYFKPCFHHHKTTCKYETISNT